MALAEHGERLADPGGGAEVDPQLPASRLGRRARADTGCRLLLAVLLAHWLPVHALALTPCAQAVGMPVTAGTGTHAGLGQQVRGRCGSSSSFRRSPAMWNRR